MTKIKPLKLEPLVPRHRENIVPQVEPIKGIKPIEGIKPLNLKPLRGGITPLELKPLREEIIPKRIAIEEPIPTVPLWEKPGRSFIAGVGDTIKTAGFATRWIGKKVGAPKLGDWAIETGDNIAREWEVPDEDPKDFEWSNLLNPNWLATRVPRALPFSLSLVPAGILGAYAAIKVGVPAAAAVGIAKLGTFGKTIIGGMGATAISRPMEGALEAGNAYEAAIARGDTEEEANKIANQIFRENLIFGGMDVGQIVLAFSPLGTKKRIGTGLAKRIVASSSKMAGVGIMEAAEEAGQDIIQRRAMGEEIAWDPQMKESAALGSIMGVGLGGAGSVYNVISQRTQRNLPLYQQEQVRRAKEGLTGIEAQRAELLELDKIAETPEGKAAIEKTSREMMELGKEFDAEQRIPVEPAVEPRREVVPEPAIRPIEPVRVPERVIPERVIPKELEPVIPTEKELKQIYKPILQKADEIEVEYVGNCTDIPGGAEFVDTQLDKAITIPKRHPIVNKIREEWKGLGGMGRNRIDDYDTDVLLNDEYLIFRESDIEYFYKLKGQPKVKVEKLPVIKGIKEVEPEVKPILKELEVLVDRTKGAKIIFESPTYKGRFIEGEFVKDIGDGMSIVKTKMPGFADFERRVKSEKIYTQATKRIEVVPEVPAVVKVKPKHPTLPKFELTRKGAKALGITKSVSKARMKSVSSKVRKDLIEEKIFDTVSIFSPKKGALSILEKIAIDRNRIMATDLETALVYESDMDFKMRRVLPKDILKGKGIKDVGEISKRAEEMEKIEDFPIVPDKIEKPITKGEISIEPEVLKKLVASVAKPETKVEISGILFQSTPKGLALVSTDSFRLWQITLPAKLPSNFKFILPGESARKLARLLDKTAPDKMMVEFDKSRAVFSFDKFKFTSRLIDGEFVDYKPILPTEIETTFEVNRMELLNVMREAKPYVPRTNDVQLSINKKENTLKIKTARPEDKVKYEKEIPVTNIKEKVKVSPDDNQYIVMQIKNEDSPTLSFLNRDFIEDFLKTAETERITGSLDVQNKPAVWKEISPEKEVMFVKDMGKPIYVPVVKDQKADYITKVVKQAYGKSYFKRKQSFVTLQLRDRGYFFGREQTVEGPDDIADLMRELKNSSREKFYVVNLDKNGKIIVIDNVSVGSVNAALVSPPEVLKSAIISNAKKVYFVHNHPSGQVRPSENDIGISIRLNKVLSELKIEVVGDVIMNRTIYGFRSPDGIFTEMKMPLETRQRAKMRIVEIEQRIKDLPEKIDKAITRPDDVVDIMELVLNKEAPIIVGLYLDAQNKINGIEIIDFSLTDPHKVGRRIMRNAVLNNASQVVIGTNKYLEKTNTIAAFQIIEDKLKLLGVELMDVVNLQGASMASKNLIGERRPIVEDEKKAFEKYVIREPSAEYEAFNLKEKKVLELLQEGKEIPENLASAIKSLQEKGIIRSPIEAMVRKLKPGETLPGFTTAEQIKKIQTVITEKRIPQHIYSKIKNGFIGHKRTRIKELTEAQADQVYQALLELTPDQVGRFKEVSPETLEALRDFISPSLFTKQAVVTGDIFRNLNENDVNYLLSMTRFSFHVLGKGTPIQQKIYNKISEAQENKDINFRDFDKEWKALYREALKEDKKAGVNVFGYIEQGWEVPAKTQALAEFLKKFFADSLPVMKPRRIRQKYITHTPLTFTEKVKTAGLKEALKDVLGFVEREPNLAPDVLANLDYILSKEKFNPFALPRTKYAEYSKKLEKSVDAYAQVYFYKKNFDPIMSDVLAMKRFQPAATQKYITKWLQNISGRPVDYGWEIGRAGKYVRMARRASSLMTRWQYIKMLGLNSGSGVANIVGGTLNNWARLSIKDFVRGHQRLLTKQGHKILSDYGITQQSMWTEPVDGLQRGLSRAERALFIFMQVGEIHLRGVPALSQIPESEFQSGILSSETRTKIRAEIARTQGLYGPAQSPLWAQTIIGRPAYQYKLWMLTEMELLYDFSKETVDFYKKNPHLLDGTINNPGLARWVRFLSLAIPLFIFGGRKIRETLEIYPWLPIAVWRTIINPMETPVGRELVNVSTFIINLVEGDIKDAKQAWAESQKFWPIFVKRGGDFYEAVTEGTVTTPYGTLQEQIKVEEAIKRLILGSQTEQRQKFLELHRMLNKILPQKEYSEWSEVFGERRIKTDYQKFKEDLMREIKNKGYRSIGDIDRDEAMVERINKYNFQAKEKLKVFFQERDKLTKIITTQKEWETYQRKVTIQKDDINRWFETDEELKELPSLLRRTQ